MKKSISLFLFVCVSLVAFAQNSDMKLVYKQPAQKVTDALILGNGRLGAMVYGGVTKEKISLNDDNFWSGEPKDWNNPQAPQYIPQVREALLKGNHELADKLMQKMQGPYNQSYQPLSELQIEMVHSENAKEYSRMLDMQKGVATVSYVVDGVTYKRTAFVSYPNQMIAIQFESSMPGKLNFQIKLSGAHQRSLEVTTKNVLKAKGKAPAHVDPSYLDAKNPVIYAETPDGKGMNYATLIKTINTGGTVSVSKQDIKVTNATKVVLLVTARTSYNGFDKSPSAQGADYEKLALDDMNKLAGKTFQQLYQVHTADFQKLFNRVELVLGNDTTSETMGDYVSKFKQNENPKFATLVYQLGRYMLIAGSRPGSQPLNLQGIWNEWVRPPWSSNYTININTQMNYWPAQSGNLAECHQPLLKFVEELAVNGAVTAKTNYNVKGWLAHHNSDIWRQSSPVGDSYGEPSWANFMGGGIWESFDFWEYYLFTQDKNFLQQRAYPLFRGAVEFSLDWLIKDEKGQLVPPFTVSSEATYITPSGYKGYTTLNTGQDVALYTELFKNYLQTCDILNKKDDLYDSVKYALKNLAPYQIDEEGKIKEWMEPGIDRPKPGNRNHVSHLIGFFPGRQLILERNDSLVNAVERTLEIFGPGNSNWMLGWEINLWARLKNADKSYEMAKSLLQRFSDNSVNFDGGYQIDWQMGYTAGVAEMLIQSHDVDENGITIIELLPALPKQWSTGHFYGVRARGGFEINMDWENGVMKKLVVKNITAKKSKVVLMVNGKKIMKEIKANGQSVVL